MVKPSAKIRRRAIAEKLAPRTLLSGEPYITYNASTRFVTIAGAADGAQSADVVTIDRVGNNLVCSIDLGNDGTTGPYTAQYAVSTVSMARVSTGDGDDTVSYRSGLYGDVQTGTGNDTIYVTRMDGTTANAVSGNAGDGDDSIYLGENGSMDAIDGFVSISGGTGYDTMYADDRASANAAYSAYDNWIERAGMRRIYYAYFDRFVLTLPDAGSTLNIGRVISYGSIIAIGGAGDDVVNIGNAANKLDEIDGPFVFEGNGGSNAITFRDDGLTTEMNAYTLTSTSLTRPGMTTATFTGADVSLRTSNLGQDAIDITITTPVHLTIDAGGNPTGLGDFIELHAPSGTATHQALSTTSGLWTFGSASTLGYTNTESVQSLALVQSNELLRETLPFALRFTFADDVTYTLDLADLAIIGPQGQPVATDGMQWNPDTHTATFTFGNGAAVPDGHYSATLAPSIGNGAASVGTPLVMSFTILRGDLDNDGSVGFGDLLILAQHFGQVGQTYSQGNIDYSADGLVGFDDLLLLAQQYGAGSLHVEPSRSKKSARSSRP